VIRFCSDGETLVSYHNNAILSSSDVKFLGIVIESSHNREAHIPTRAYIVQSLLLNEGD
jgi:hypothetical protein